MRAVFYAFTVVLLSALPCAAQANCGMKCGQERWAIKTLTDKDANLVGNATAKESSVAALVKEIPPTKLTGSRSPLEKQRFHLTALIIGWKIEDKASGHSTPDHDFHIVIAQPDDTTKQMIVEVPDPQCQAVCSSGFLSQIQQARQDVATHLGTPTSSVQALAKPWLVEITGPAFFDFEHGQVGLSEHCIEIHPVMQIKFLNQQGAKVQPHKATDMPHTCGAQ